MDDITASDPNNFIGLAVKLGRNEERLRTLEASYAAGCASADERAAKAEARLDALEDRADVTRRALQLLAGATGKRLTVKIDAVGDETMSVEEDPDKANGDDKEGSGKAKGNGKAKGEGVGVGADVGANVGPIKGEVGAGAGVNVNPAKQGGASQGKSSLFEPYRRKRNVL
jgi:hypothetical protein